MILSNLEKKWLYGQPLYDHLKTTKTTFSAVRGHSIIFQEIKGVGVVPLPKSHTSLKLFISKFRLLISGFYSLHIDSSCMCAYQAYM